MVLQRARKTGERAAKVAAGVLWGMAGEEPPCEYHAYCSQCARITSHVIVNGIITCVTCRDKDIKRARGR